MNSFSYHKPESLGEAIALLGEHGENASILAGGIAVEDAVDEFHAAVGVGEQPGSMAVGAQRRVAVERATDEPGERVDLHADTAAVAVVPACRIAGEARAREV